GMLAPAPAATPRRPIPLGWRAANLMAMAVFGGVFGWEVAMAMHLSLGDVSRSGLGAGIVLGIVGGSILGLAVELTQEGRRGARILGAMIAGVIGAVFGGGAGVAVGGMVSSHSVQGRGLVMIVGMVLGAILGGVSGARSQPNPAGDRVGGK